MDDGGSSDHYIDTLARPLDSSSVEAPPETHFAVTHRDIPPSFF